MKKFIVAILTIIFVTGCSIEKIDQDELKAKIDANKFSEEYSKIKVSNNNPYRYKTDKEIIQILKKGTGIIYFGFSECPWCREAVPQLTKAAKEMDIDTIYYFNPKEIRDNNTKEYQEIVDLLKDYLPLDENGNKRLMVPDVYFVSKGVIVGHHFKTIDAQTDSTKEPLTSSGKNELKNIYKKLISRTYNIECDC